MQKIHHLIKYALICVHKFEHKVKPVLKFSFYQYINHRILSGKKKVTFKDMYRYCNLNLQMHIDVKC